MPANSQHRRIYSTKRWRELRAQVLREEPVCHWCGRRPSTQADHVVELARGGAPYDRSNLVGACRQCNSRRGSMYQAKKAAAKKSRQDFLGQETGSTPPPMFSVSRQEKTGRKRTAKKQADRELVGRIAPRLETPRWGGKDYADQVAAFALEHLRIELMPWQMTALAGQLEHETGKLTHREALISTARQNGKTVALAALAGWWLTEMPKITGRPQAVTSTAHKLDRAVATFKLLAGRLEELGGKVTWSYGRQACEMPDGSTWTVSAATPSNAHGSSSDLVMIDEIWNIGPDVIFDAYRPSMIARPNPLMSMWSTAGTDHSSVMLQLREQALRAIEADQPGRLYFAEWSPPPTAILEDPETWTWANPALGTTITLDALLAAAETPDRRAFLRAHVNTWTTASGSWLPHGVWDRTETADPMPAGGVLAIESDLHDLRYVGVRVARRQDGKLQARSEFVVDSTDALWENVETLCADPAVTLAATPMLAEFTPTHLRRRLEVVGSQEMYRYTTLVRNMLQERHLLHAGQIALTEHVARAVAASSRNSLTLSSQKSAGPIELARCLVWAAGLEGKPAPQVRRAAIARSR